MPSSEAETDSHSAIITRHAEIYKYIVRKRRSCSRSFVAILRVQQQIMNELEAKRSAADRAIQSLLRASSFPNCTK